jgi:D-alanyl-D-alanine carboxypeptidase
VPSLEGPAEALRERLSARWPDPIVSVAVVIDGALESFTAGPRSAALSSQGAPRFLIYSLSKTLLALCALRLTEEGRLALDAPIASWVPELGATAERITPRQLLRHTSGLPDYGPLPEYHAAVREHALEPWSHDEFLRRTDATRLRVAPDEGWDYSNIGYMLVRAMVERASGGTFGQEVARALGAVPTSLHSAPMLSVAMVPHDLRALAPGWSRLVQPRPAGGVGEPVDIRGRYHPGWVAHGTLSSDAASVAAVFASLFDGRLVGRSLVAAMLEPWPVPVTHPHFQRPSYGLGLMIDPAAPRGRTAGHTGGGPGYSAAAYSVVESGVARATAAVLTNVEADDEAEDLALALLDDARA